MSKVCAKKPQKCKLNISNIAKSTAISAVLFYFMVENKILASSMKFGGFNGENYQISVSQARQGLPSAPLMFKGAAERKYTPS